MSRSLLVAVTRAWETELVTTLRGSRAWEVARRCPDLADLLAAATAGVAEVAVVSADLRLLDRSALADLAAAGVGILGVYPPGDEVAQRRLRQWGLAAVIAADAELVPLESALHTAFEHRGELIGADALAGSPEALDALDDVDLLTGHHRVLSHQEPGADAAAPGPSGSIVAVWGPTGAPGRSLLARNLAAELAGSGRATLLIDADPYGGTQAQALALLNEAPGLLAAARAADQGVLDLPTLARLAPYVCADLRILTGIPGAGRWPELRAAPLRHVLGLARSLCEMVVVDCGFCLEEDEELSYDTRAPRRNAATLACLRAADLVVATGAADPIGLQRLVRGLTELGEVLDPPGAPAGQAVRTVVVNRVREAAVGPGPHERIRSAVVRFGGVSDVVLLPDDPAVADGALLAGQTLAEFASGAPLQRAVASLARDLIARLGRDRGADCAGPARDGDGGGGSPDAGGPDPTGPRGAGVGGAPSGPVDPGPPGRTRRRRRRFRR